MSMDTTRADMTQAVLEGVAFGLRDSLKLQEALESRLNAPRSAAAEQRALVEKIIANVMNLKVDVLEVKKDHPWEVQCWQQ